LRRKVGKEMRSEIVRGTGTRDLTGRREVIKREEDGTDADC